MYEIIEREPVNKVAALVTSKGIHWDAGMPGKDRFHSDICPALKDLETIKNTSPTFEDLTGTRTGYFTVVGISADHKKDKKRGAKWVVRCDCGKYEIRYKRTIKNPESFGDRCFACFKKASIKRSHHWRVTGEDKDQRLF